MKVMTVAVALWMAFGAAPVRAQQAEDLESVAVEAGVDATDLLGAVYSTGLGPRTYLEGVGELKRPFQWPTGRLACIAWVESRNDPNATNRFSKAAGLFQFLWSTWATTPQGKQGLSPYDPQAATEAAEWMVRQGRIREWVAVSGGYC